jgi:hypothetical protein
VNNAKKKNKQRLYKALKILVIPGVALTTPGNKQTT